MKLGPPANNNFPVLDYFTPYNQGSLDAGDVDVASGGLVLLPTLPSGQQLLAQQGKQGTIYLLNINNLGKYCVNLTPACTNSDPQIVQEIKGASPGIWGSPAYWNGNLYWTGANDHIKAYSFNANNSGLDLDDADVQERPDFRVLRAHSGHFLQRQYKRHSCGHWTAARMTRRAAAAGPIAWDCTPTMRPILRTCSTPAARRRTTATLRAPR